MFWADSKARLGQYSKASEVYAFGVCAHFLIWGQPLFHKENQLDYLNNRIKSKNAWDDGFLLQGIINRCLDDDIEARPTFETLEKEVFNHFLETLLKAARNEKDALTAQDKNALDLIKDYATLPILAHQEREYHNTCLMRACASGRLLVVIAIIEWGVDLNAQNKRGETALDWAIGKGKHDVA
jgi:hypothetical protein